MKQKYWIRAYDARRDEIFQFHTSLDMLQDPDKLEISSTRFPRTPTRELTEGRWVIVPNIASPEDEP